MNRILSLIEKFLKYATIFCIGLMLILVFGQVITRYCFGYTPSFGEELARYLFVWTVFLSMPLLAKAGGHMAIETLTSRVHGKALKTCRILADSFTIAFLAIMVWHGCTMVMLSYDQTSPAMEIPMSYVYAVIPFGCLIMLIYTVQNFIEVVRTPAEEVK